MIVLKEVKEEEYAKRMGATRQQYVSCFHQGIDPISLGAGTCGVRGACSSRQSFPIKLEDLSVTDNIGRPSLRYFYIHLSMNASLFTGHCLTRPLRIRAASVRVSLPLCPWPDADSV